MNMRYYKRLEIPAFEARITELPCSESWEMDDGQQDGFVEYGNIDYTGLTPVEQICLCVYAWNKQDLCPRRSTIMKTLDLPSKYAVSKLVKESGCIKAVSTFDESNGLINGRGYQLDKEIYILKCQ